MGDTREHFSPTGACLGCAALNGTRFDTDGARRALLVASEYVVCAGLTVFVDVDNELELRAMLAYVWHHEIDPCAVAGDPKRSGPAVDVRPGESGFGSIGIYEPDPTKGPAFLIVCPTVDGQEPEWLRPAAYDVLSKLGDTESAASVLGCEGTA